MIEIYLGWLYVTMRFTSGAKPKCVHLKLVKESWLVKIQLNPVSETKSQASSTVSCPLPGGPVSLESRKKKKREKWCLLLASYGRCWGGLAAQLIGQGCSCLKGLCPSIQTPFKTKDSLWNIYSHSDFKMEKLNLMLWETGECCLKGKLDNSVS